jgi:purine-nucleoside phosphorylase
MVAIDHRDAEVERLTRSLTTHGIGEFELAFVLGSGLGAFAERLEHAQRVPFADIDGLPQPHVAGHSGQLVLGELAGVRVLVQQGRVHLYEGWTAREVTRAVRAFCSLGCRGVVLTNAAGGLHPQWKPGTLMRIADHLDLQARTPLVPSERSSGAIYSAELGAALDRGAKERGIALERGVYAGLLGPSYETPAEIRMLRAIGADAVGMSTVAEALAARSAGARVAGVSLITNLAAGISPTRLDHAEVLAAGRAAAQEFCSLLEGCVPHLAAALGST